MNHFLITGGAGFIGMNIALRLVKSGASVCVLDNFTSGLSRYEFDQTFQAYLGNIKVIKGDVRDFDACRHAMDGITHVLHHAAISSALQSIEDPVETMAVNVVGTANLLSAARESGTVERFINASSCAVYGDGPSSGKSESAMVYPGSPFATSMQASEGLCTNYFRSYMFCAASVRYFNVYGSSELTSGRPRSVVAKFIDATLNNRDVTVHGSGNQTRDFIHIDDAVTAIIKMCECEPHFIGGQMYNIGSGERFSVLDLLEMISLHAGRPIDCVSAKAVPHEMQHSKADIVKASSVLGFKAQISLETGILDMISAATQLKRAA